VTPLPRVVKGRTRVPAEKDGSRPRAVVRHRVPRAGRRATADSRRVQFVPSHSHVSPYLAEPRVGV